VSDLLANAQRALTSEDSLEEEPLEMDEPPSSPTLRTDVFKDKAVKGKASELISKIFKRKSMIPLPKPEANFQEKRRLKSRSFIPVSRSSYT
jgi:hypothetical protein